jgi:CRISPR-associated protein Cas1
MRNSMVKTIELDKNGYYLARKAGAFVVYDEKRKERARYPNFENEVGQIRIRSGNLVSSGALTTAVCWDIPVIVESARGHPLGAVLSFYNQSHVQTRIAQYESLSNGKAPIIAKTILLSKLRGQNQILKKFGLRRIDFSIYERINALPTEDLNRLRAKLLAIEGHEQMKYFDQVFSLFEESVRPSGRKTYQAFDAINNLFNLSYKALAWRVHLSLIRAKLEPFLGYLHRIAFGRPSLICDMLEPFRYLMDDFVLENAREFRPKDFALKTEYFSKRRKGKREYLYDKLQNAFFKKLDAYFKSTVEIPRIRVGKRQEIETLINEEAMLLAKFLRNERKEWTPRIAELS